MVVPSISTLSMSREPPEIRPVVVMLLEPVSMVPKPLVIDPESNAATVVNEDVTTQAFSVVPETALADTVPPLLLAA
jgi:hypothetical protein